MVESDSIDGIVGVELIDREVTVGVSGNGVRALGVVVPLPGRLASLPVAEGVLV